MQKCSLIRGLLRLVLYTVLWRLKRQNAAALRVDSVSEGTLGCSVSVR